MVRATRGGRFLTTELCSVLMIEMPFHSVFCGIAGLLEPPRFNDMPIRKLGNPSDVDSKTA
jgi:hypothetical protein